MARIETGSHPKVLWPGIQEHFKREYERFAVVSDLMRGPHPKPLSWRRRVRYRLSEWLENLAGAILNLADRLTR